MRILTIEEFIIKAKKIHSDYYNYNKTNYKRHNIKVIITCPIHGDFLQTPNSHLNGSGCKQCGFKKRNIVNTLTTEQFIKTAHLIHGDKYHYTKTIYKKAQHNVVITCQKHGDFQQLPTHHIKGVGCPKCSSSHGEQIIQQYLDKHNIKCGLQRFKDCKNSKPLPFDFYIPKFNLLIEYHGEQHYRPIKQFGGEKAFIKRKYNDDIKLKYALEKGITLLVIPFHQKDNIEEILNKYCR